MRVLIAHNYYGDYATGGEGNVAQADVDLLASHGHKVQFYKKTNEELLKGGVWEKLRLPFKIIYSHDTYNEVKQIIKEFKPDILHVHNYKYIFTPSIFQAAKDCGVKTVLTLHNYRLLCPCALFCCNARPCEKCLDGFPFRVLWNSCDPYDHSFFQRALQLYFYLGTSKKIALSENLVDGFIALTPFTKERLVKKGIPSNKIYVRPNFIDVTTTEVRDTSIRHGAVYVGRLAPEKGIDFLLDAWQGIDYPLTVVGTGPLEEYLKKKSSAHVKFTGELQHSDMMKLLAESSFLVFPSVCYEGFPLTIVEAFSLKIPVIASDLGPRREVVKDGETGLLFESLNSNSLKEKVLKLIDDSSLSARMGINAYKFFLENYTNENAYSRLVDIYQKVISSR